MKIKIFAAILFMMAFTVPSWAMDRYEKLIQGAWHYSQSDGRGLGMSLQYSFHRGNYELKGYPQLHQTGHYRVLKVKDSTMQVLFYDKKGDLPKEDKEILITVNPDGPSLMIDHQGPWAKVKLQSE
jgi:hypothetical protein